METFSARLASFTVSQQGSKKGKSEAKTSKALKWPHKTLSPDELAKSGFFYQPSKSSPDNATCYLCHSNLDGWEEGDDPVQEHIRHAPFCGWANVIAIEQAIENGNRDLDDPIQEKQSNARLMTFGSRWPHENKRGWVCKSLKMVEAGWYYCPTPESDDFVKCAYCSLSLDGWEPKDNPYEEHQRRSPDCLFFSLSAVSRSAKSVRAKKGRTSKASRMSTQSINSNVTDELRSEETELKEDSVLSVAGSMATTKAKASKKGSKAKEPKNPRAKNALSKPDNTQNMSSIVEPEDDDFEVKVRHQEPVGKGKKRKSAEMESPAETQYVNASEDETTHLEAPAKRRRATRPRTDSVAQSNARAQPSERSVIDESIDVAMNDAENDAEDHSLLTKPSVKKTAKGRKQRASSRSRKPSAASAVPKASPHAPLPNDDEIDAALQEDLERPLTDYGSDNEAPPVKNPKGRRVTRSKTSSDTSAPKAPARVAAETSVATTEDSSADLYPNLPAQVESSVPGTLETEVSRPVAPKAKTKKQTGRKASAKEVPKSNNTRETRQISDLDETQASAGKPSKTQTRQDFQEISNHEAHDLDISGLNHAQNTDLNSASVLHDADMENDEAENKPKSNPSKKKTAKGGKKKNASSSQPTQADDKAGTEDVTETLVHDEEPPQTENDTAAPPGPELPESETFAEPEKTPQPSKTIKPAKAPRVKKANAKNQAAAISAPAVEAEAEEVTAPAEAALSNSPVVTASAPPTPQRTLAAASGHSTPINAGSPQSSDAENHPPSSMPSQTRPPLTLPSPSKHHNYTAALTTTTNTNTESPGAGSIRIPLATITPLASPSKSSHHHHNHPLGPSSSFSRLHSTLPWTPADMDLIFQAADDVFSLTSAAATTSTTTIDTNNAVTHGGGVAGLSALSSPEKRLNVEEWIRWKAAQAEDALRGKCESVVGRFEGEGVRALRCLEGIECVD